MRKLSTFAVPIGTFIVVHACSDQRTCLHRRKIVLRHSRDTATVETKFGFAGETSIASLHCCLTPPTGGLVPSCRAAFKLIITLGLQNGVLVQRISYRLTSRRSKFLPCAVPSPLKRCCLHGEIQTWYLQLLACTPVPSTPLCNRSRLPAPAKLCRTTTELADLRIPESAYWSPTEGAAGAERPKTEQGSNGSCTGLHLPVHVPRKQLP